MIQREPRCKNRLEFGRGRKPCRGAEAGCLNQKGKTAGLDDGVGMRSLLLNAQVYA